jgi:hypothetical protein
MTNIKEFLEVYNKHYKTLDIEDTLKHIAGNKYIIFDGCLFVYVEFGTHIYNSLLLFDINQVKEPIRAFKRFKEIIKDFNKPVYVCNVKKEFRSLAVLTKEKDVYRWKS